MNKMKHFLTQTQFELLYEDATESVFFLIQKEHSFEYLYINKKARLIFTENPINKNLHDMVAPSLLDEINKNYLKAIRENRKITFQDFFLFSNVELVNETTVQPIQTEFGTYILATTREVSKQKEKEEKFLYMESLLNMTAHSTVTVTNEGKIFDMNAKFEELFGYKLNDWQGKDYLDLNFIPPNQQGLSENDFETNFSEVKESSTLVKRIKTNGEEGTFLVSYSPIKNDDETVAMYILLQEVTDKVELKTRLSNTQHILQNYKKAISKAAMVVMVNRKGIIDYTNDLFENITGYEKNEIVGKHITFLHNDLYNDVKLRTMWKAVLKNQIWHGELRNCRKDGTFYWMDTKAIPLFNEWDQIETVIIIQFDITEKKKIMIELESIEKTFKLITENTNDLIAITDEKGKVLYTSPSHELILGYSNETLMNRQLSDILSSDFRDIWQNDVLKRVKEDEETRLELQYMHNNNNKLWTETSIVAVQNDDRPGKFQHIIVSREITERKKLEEHLRFMAYHDSLTQLPNRSHLLKEFPKLISQKDIKNSSIAVLFLDGDDFKSVNDSYGHDIGDEFLTMFGKTLLTSVREHDLVARVGGDEFVILITQLPNDPIERMTDIEKIISRIRCSLHEGWAIEEIKFNPTTSIGISLYPDHGNSLDELLEKADDALYQVKRLGKNQHLIFSE